MITEDKRDAVPVARAADEILIALHHRLRHLLFSRPVTTAQTALLPTGEELALWTLTIIVASIGLLVFP